MWNSGTMETARASSSNGAVFALHRDHVHCVYCIRNQFEHGHGGLRGWSATEILLADLY